MRALLYRDYLPGAVIQCGFSETAGGGADIQNNFVTEIKIEGADSAFNFREAASKHLLAPFTVFVGFGVYGYNVAFLDESRHLDNYASFQGCILHDRSRGVAFDD